MNGKLAISFGTVALCSLAASVSYCFSRPSWPTAIGESTFLLAPIVAFVALKYPQADDE